MAPFLYIQWRSVSPLEGKPPGRPAALLTEEEVPRMIGAPLLRLKTLPLYALWVSQFLYASLRSIDDENRC